MKKFENKAEDGKEKAIRHGYSVPPGAVNIAWTKSPTLSPKNNTIIIDTSRVSGDNANQMTKRKQVAYANYMGILEDAEGNQIWDDEYPVISDVFVPDVEDKYGDRLKDEDVLPFVHVSRHFHVDFGGLVAGQRLEEYDTAEIKVVDKHGVEYLYADGQKRYKTFMIPVEWSGTSTASNDMAYRVYVFIDMDAKHEELFLKYNKVEIDKNGSFKNQNIDYQETINPREYFKYIPEESDIVDHTYLDQKLYSTKPVNMKDKSLDLPQNNYQGWNIYVPRKAIPDPRIFQLFRWRLACEFTRSVTPPEQTSDDFQTAIQIKAGVIVPKDGNHLYSRANYFFYQLNNTDYNFSKVQFYNPLKSPEGSYTESAQRAASYWHVDISAVSMEDIAKFDVLVWAPSATARDFGPFLPKINHFVENAGGTLIIETSSNCDATGLNGITFSPRLTHPTSPTTSPVNNFTTANTMRLYDATADNPNDTFSNYGMWKVWPPNVSDILTKYTDTGSILTSASPIAGWDLTAAEKVDITAYNEIPNMKFQYISSYPPEYKRVLEARKVSDSTYQATMIHKKFTGGGNIFISSASIFEDHLFEPSGDMIMRTMNIENFNNLANNWRMIFNNITSSLVQSAEMKLRLNTMMLATVFKPSPKATDTMMLDPDEDRQSLTIYTPWQSSWVINPEDGVLTEKEIDDFDFVLRTTSPTDLDPIWQRKLTSKTAGQLINEEIKRMDPDGTSQAIRNFAGATKRYFIMVTNQNVEVPESSLINDSSAIMAWTDSYSPKFEVPYYLGPYKIRDEMVAGTGVGRGKRTYPPKPFAGRVSATYLTSSSEATSITAKVKLTATVKRDLTIDDPNVIKKIWHPGTTTTSYVLKSTRLSWKDAPLGYTAGYQHMFPKTRAIGLETYTDANYLAWFHRPTNWPQWERWGYHAAGIGSYHTYYGNRGDNVYGIQRLLNIFIGKGYIPGPYLKVDSYYGSVTASKVRQFQAWKGARWVDGIVDAETWSLLGYTLAGIQTHSDWPAIRAREGFDTGPTGPYPQGNAYRLWGWQAAVNLREDIISDEQIAVMAPGPNRQSWYRNGPDNVWQTYLVRFNSNHPWADLNGRFRAYGLTIIPHGLPQAMTWFDMSDRTTLTNAYVNGAGRPGAVSGQWGQGIEPARYINISFPERRLNSIAFTMKSLSRMSQHFVGSYGTSRRLGVKDVWVNIRYNQPITSTTPGYYTEESVDPGTVHTITKTNTLNYEATFTFKVGQGIKIDPMDALKKQIAAIMADEPARTISSRTVSSIKWDINSVTFPNNPGLSAYMDVVFRNYDTATLDRNDVTITFNGYGLLTQPGKYVAGPWIGDGSTNFYSKTLSGKMSPYVQKYGWVAKDEGIKLLCDSEGKPIGFPAIPTGAAANVHYANYVLDPSNTDQTPFIGLYDLNRNEWILNAAGDPEMSYYDYIRRGPLNIYMAVQTTYELDIASNLPGANAPVSRPFKWAMPVYGVTSGLQSQLQLMPLNPDLSATDIWPIAVKTGSFSKSVVLRPKSQGALTGPLKDYQGKAVEAFYGLPESASGPWSSIYGRPYTDVIEETPIILDDNIIQVRQFPILSVQEPTATPSLADPWVPVLKVEVRQSLTAPWVTLTWPEITDYNLTQGRITLRDNLPSNDARLVRVTYTSATRIYNFKHDGVNKINLNPYISVKPEWQNVPLYVYIVPEYVTDSENNTIPNTTKTRTLNITTETSIFNPTQANYDPLAVMLGVVYITTAFDINELSILDTRRRGGGATTALTDDEVVSELPEGDSFWDIIPPTATSYQKGGYVLIRLPKEIVSKFDPSYVIGVPGHPDKIGVIARNLTAGVGYKLQTLEGEDMEWVE
jgi:hypothetical protein